MKGKNKNLEPKPVTAELYALSTCPASIAVYDFLTGLGVTVKVSKIDFLPDLEVSTALKSLAQHNFAETFPTSIIGSRVVVGYLKDDLRAAVKKYK